MCKDLNGSFLQTEVDIDWWKQYYAEHLNDDIADNEVECTDVH